jgi:molybdopterin synthase sulfur carrier subunit
MSITIAVPNALLPYSGGSTRVRVDGGGGSVIDVLRVLATRHPGIVDRVLTETGEVRPHVNLFVGEENIRFEQGLSTRVDDGATLTIVPAVSGG